MYDHAANENHKTANSNLFHGIKSPSSSIKHFQDDCLKTLSKAEAQQGKLYHPLTSESLNGAAMKRIKISE